MLSVLAITIPIYACVAIGHLAVRRGILDRADMRVLATFVISFALPCMLFLAIATRPVADIVNPTYLTAYAIGSVLAFATGYTLARARGATAAERAFDGLGIWAATATSSATRCCCSPFLRRPGWCSG